MRYLFILLLLILSFGAFAQHDSIPPMPAYDTVYYGGFEGDKPCAQERLRAISENKLYYIEPTIYAPRYIKYMQPCCNPYHLTYYFILEEQLGLSGFNPMRCYIAAMDSMVKVKYGADIKTKIAAKADSLFLADIARDTMEARYCTTLASLPDKSIYTGLHGEIFHFTCPADLYNKFKQQTSPVSEPVMLMSLLIEANGKVSRYKLNYFESDGDIFYADTMKHHKVFDACGKDFVELAITGLQQYTTWQPAMVKTLPVRAWHSVEVRFEPKKN